jgi:hypothetical protein
VPARRIVVTAGASAALQLACLALIEAGDEILMPDPSYPCNRHFVSAADGKAVLVPTTAADRFQLSAAQVEAALGTAHPRRAAGVALQPDRHLHRPQELRRIHDVVRNDGWPSSTRSTWACRTTTRFGQSALAMDDQVISINSFQVLQHDRLAPGLDGGARGAGAGGRAPGAEPVHLRQHGGAVRGAGLLRAREHRRIRTPPRRVQGPPRLVHPALESMGLPVPVMPDGAFYAWADCSAWCQRLGISGSWELAFETMDKAHVAVTPGRDFGTADTAKFVRFSTASSMEHLQEAVHRLAGQDGATDERSRSRSASTGKTPMPGASCSMPTT